MLVRTCAVLISIRCYSLVSRVGIDIVCSCYDSACMSTDLGTSTCLPQMVSAAMSCALPNLVGIKIDQWPAVAIVDPLNVT